MSERITVIVVCTLEDETPDGPLMHAVHSVETQTYDRDLVDTHIVRNLDGSDIRTMQRFGVEQADTPLVAFINVNEVWPPQMLDSLVAGLGGLESGYAIDTPTARGFVCGRDYFLENA